MPKAYRKNYLKTIMVPFISGIIGASLVVGICFGVPQIREKIISKEAMQSNLSNNNGNTTQNNNAQINAKAISLEGYSETSMGVADKVLPSIVGIEIEYTVNSFFGRSTSTATGSGIIISEDRIYTYK